MQADLRDARARLLADELVGLTQTLAQEVADETALRQRRDEVERELAEGRRRLSEVEHAAQQAAPRLARAQETWYRLSSLRERIRGTATLAAERQRLLSESAPERAPGRDPDELEAQARAVGEQEAALAEEVDAAREVLEAAVEVRHDAERAEGEEERRLQGLLRAAADRREGLARLAGQAAAKRSRLEAGEEETHRLQESIAEAEQRALAAQDEFRALETQVAGVEAGEEDLDAEHETAAAVLAELDGRIEHLRQAGREAEQERATWTARREALELGLRRKDGAGTVLAAGARLSGVLGSVAALLQVQPGHENAVAAALGVAADAVAVESAADADAALRLLKSEDAGRAALLVASGVRGHGMDRSGWPTLPAGARWARDLVQGPSALSAALDRLLDRVAVVADLDAARRLVADAADINAVTFAGDVVGAGLVQGGSASSPSLLEVQAAVDEAAEKVTEAGRRAEQAGDGLRAATARRAEAAERVERALDRLHESDARLAAVAEQLGQLGSTARAARGEADRLRSSLAAKEAALEGDRQALEELEERLYAAESDPQEAEEPSTEDRD
ncbi:MAG TPA: chromosome segregation protein SMC, partial [Actinomycetota bacterium]|nr:chromosome segregation protein SMC [Actinomycetota bacterium]